MKKIIVTFSILIIGIFSIKAQEAGNTNAPEAKFDKLVHDYGKVLKGGNGICEFKLTNIGKQPLILASCRSSCGCTVPNCPKAPIMPGKSIIIKVRYDTKRLGVFNKTITVNSNAKNKSIILCIKGEIIKPVKK